MRHIVLFAAAAALSALAACSSAPCEGFCRIQCEKVITCKNGQHPDVDGCVQDCTDFVEQKGATEDADCECSGSSCANEPTSLWAAQYEC